MKFSDADYMGIAVGATYSLCNPHLNRKFMKGYSVNVSKKYAELTKFFRKQKQCLKQSH